MSDELKTFIGEKMGEATVCWNPIPTSVFDSERATKILSEIYVAIYQQLYYEVDALIIGAYYSPLESIETHYDILAKQRLAELNSILTNPEHKES